MTQIFRRYPALMDHTANEIEQTDKQPEPASSFKNNAQRSSHHDSNRLT